MNASCPWDELPCVQEPEAFCSRQNSSLSRRENLTEFVICYTVLKKKKRNKKTDGKKEAEGKKFPTGWKEIRWQRILGIDGTRVNQRHPARHVSNDLKASSVRPLSTGWSKRRTISEVKQTVVYGGGRWLHKLSRETSWGKGVCFKIATILGRVRNAVE